MISYLKGHIMHKHQNGVIVLSNQMGYDILLPQNRLLQYHLEQEVEFFTYLHVREDLIQLYGFESWAEKDFFMLLLNVSGVGPKGALAIIGQSTLSGIHQAIANENIDFLTKVPGVGKKTAQRLVLELRDKLPVGDYFSLMDQQNPSSEASDNKLAKNAVFDALVGMGFHESEIKRIYPDLQALPEDADEKTIIKKALQLLAQA